MIFGTRHQSNLREPRSLPLLCLLSHVLMMEDVCVSAKVMACYSETGMLIWYCFLKSFFLCVCRTGDVRTVWGIL